MIFVVGVVPSTNFSGDTVTPMLHVGMSKSTQFKNQISYAFVIFMTVGLACFLMDARELIDSTKSNPFSLLCSDSV